VKVVASLSQGRTAAAQCGLFTHKSVPVIFEPPCISSTKNRITVRVKDSQTDGTTGPNGITMEEIKKTEKYLLVRNLPLFFYFGFSP